ncbi:MAG: dihydroorotase [Granulosicoccus sp.]|nr:dihydroorotase [Granulosicoccus sp.]
MTNTSILNARVINPESDSDGVTDIHISGQNIVATGTAPADYTAEQTINAAGMVACPGLIDVYARLREPGYEKKTDIQTETRAALLNGITTLICSPDTDPVIDEVATVELIHRRVQDARYARVHPLAAMTRQLDGSRLSELATLTNAGCVGASHADVPLSDTLVIRRVMEYAKTFDIVLMFNPVDQWLAAGGCAHEGRVATRLGLPGIPVAAETVALSMLLELARTTGVRIHLSRITSARGAELIRDAKSRGMPVTADTSINHLFVTEQALADFDSVYHSVAPFRSLEDLQKLREAAIDGTFDALCSDHAPHEADAKLAPFPATEAGLSTLDTYLPQLLEFGKQEQLSLAATLKLATSGPASIFGLDAGTLNVGATADIVLLDLEAKRVIDKQNLLSRGKNSPRLNEELAGVIRHVFMEGQQKL